MIFNMLTDMNQRRSINFAENVIIEYNNCKDLEPGFLDALPFVHTTIRFVSGSITPHLEANFHPSLSHTIKVLTAIHKLTFKAITTLIFPWDFNLSVT